MKIGIITFWWTDENYGQILQLYGLYSYLTSLGHDVEVIRYRPSNKKDYLQIATKISTIELSRTLLKKIRSSFNSHKLSKQRDRNPRMFEDFRKQQFSFSSLQYSHIEELRMNAPAADLYICGSDQIWNYIRPTPSGFDQLDAYTLQFGNQDTKRISYAASFGFAGIQEQVGERLARNLRNIDAVSVREDFAVKVLNRFGIESITVAPDPSMLLSREQYGQIIDSHALRSPEVADYFIYLVKNRSMITLKDIVSTMKKRHLHYFATGANEVVDSRLNYFPTISEWLFQIQNAKVVVTNSFHGCVFSIIFQTDFYYFPLQANIQGFEDSRIETFLSKLGIEGRKITSRVELEHILDTPAPSIDWGHVAKSMDGFVSVGTRFLDDAIAKCTKSMV